MSAMNDPDYLFDREAIANTWPGSRSVKLSRSIILIFAVPIHP